VVLAVFSAGLLLGGEVSAAVLWLLSGLAEPLPPTAGYAAVVASALLGVLRDAKLVQLSLPQNARQVPQLVLQRGLVSGGFQFGFELGTGVRTYVSSTAPYVVAAALLLSEPSLLTALVTGVGFGAGRALTALVRRGSGLGVEPWRRHLDARLGPVTVGASAAILAGFAILLLP
jgi:hypothetical protein